MRINRTKNAIKNIKAGMILKIYQTIVPFLMRTAMIHFMGVQYLGLNSLFASILHVLNLTELGVGTAMVFSMYNPIARDDEKTICALINLYRKYYRIIGLVIGVAGLLLTPFIPHLISGEVPEELNIYALYLLNLAGTVLTYWLFAYKNCLLQAHQRTDIASIVTGVTYSVQCAFQLLVLLVYKNYYLYVIISLGTQILNNIMTAWIVTKKYPRYRPSGTLSREETKEINQKISDIFTARLGSVVLRHSDTIVISAFLGLTTLAIYQNYYFIVASIIGVVEIILSSMTAGLGNSYILETKEKNYRDLEKFTFLFMWLIGICTCCFLGMYQPFMELWVGKELMLKFPAVVWFAVYFFVYTFNRLLSTYKDAAGLWHANRFCPLVTALVNLILNLWWIQSGSIYGVLLSTVISLIGVGVPWNLHNLFSLYFDKTIFKSYVRQLLLYIAVTIGSGILVSLICTKIKSGSYFSLILCAIVSFVVPNIVFFVCLREEKQFRASIQFADKITKHKLNIEKLLCGGDIQKNS